MISWPQFLEVLAVNSPVIYAYPIALWLLVIVVGFIWFNKYNTKPDDWQQLGQQKNLVFRHSLIEKLNFSKPAKKHSFNLVRWLLSLLRYILLILIVLTLAKPIKEVNLPAEPQTKTVRDVVFVIESSASMMLVDYEIEAKNIARMEAIKLVVDEFIAGLDGNRFSFILYADQAYTLMPITADIVTARLMLKKLKPYLAGRQDEALGEALGLALQQASQNTEYTQKTIVVLFSDGENKSSKLPIAEAINYAQSLNVPLYTVGVGAETEQADKRKYTGLLYQPLEDETLKKIASQTNGQYFQVGSRQALKQVLAEVDNAEGVVLTKPQLRKKIVDLYPYLLILILIVFALYFILVQSFSRQLQGEQA